MVCCSRNTWVIRLGKKGLSGLKSILYMYRLWFSDDLSKAEFIESWLMSFEVRETVLKVIWMGWTRSIPWTTWWIREEGSIVKVALEWIVCKSFNVICEVGRCVLLRHDCSDCINWLWILRASRQSIVLSKDINSPVVSIWWVIKIIIILVWRI